MDNEKEVHRELKAFKRGNYTVIIAAVIILFLSIFQGKEMNEVAFILFAQSGALVLTRRDQYSLIGFIVLFIIWLTAKSNKLRVSDGDHIDTEASLWAYIMPLVQAVIFTILLFTYDYFQSMGIFEGRPFWFFLLIIPLAALISGIPRMLFDTFVIFNENEKVAYRDHKFQ